MFSSKDSRRLLRGKDGHEEIMKGVNAITDSIQVTLGPSGRTVLFSRPMDDPRATKDGYTVAREFKAKDPVEEMGASMIRAASRETVNEAGDGTSTTAILARAILRRGFDLVHTRHNPTLVRRAIMSAAEVATEFISQSAEPVDPKDEKTLYEVALISANGEEEIASVVTEAITQAGEYGQVVIEEGRSFHDTLHKTDGCQYRRGFLKGVFVNDSKRQAIHYKDAAVILIQDRIGSPRDVMTVIKSFVEGEGNNVTGLKKPVIIMAQEFDNSAVEFLGMLKTRGMEIGAALTPSFGDNGVSTLIDISIQTGGKVVGRSHAIGLDAIGPMDAAGEVEEIIITRDKMIFIGGKGDPELIQDRADTILEQIKNAPNDFERTTLEGRLAKFFGSIVTIRVGGKSEVELKERLDRVDDALSAVRCAIEDGVVPGGGTMLLKCAKKLENRLEEILMDPATSRETIEGYRLMIEAFAEPLQQICRNSYHEGEYYSRIIMDDPELRNGFNALTGKLTDVVADGIIDPAKVVKTALKNAASTASTLMTADVVMAHEDMEKTVDS